MAVQITHSGGFDNLKRFFSKMKSPDIKSQLETYGKIGVSMLAEATPKDTGITAASWDYRVTIEGDVWKVMWTNGHQTYQGDPIVILLQFGHGTGTGGYVQGRDFINPAMRPVFDQLVNDIWRVVQNA